MNRRIPLITCICPTYKRPEHLANAIACFEQQTIDKVECELLILDDAGQYHTQVNGNWCIITSQKRYDTLPAKFNWLVEHSRGEIMVVWEDDDIYLPDHLARIAHAYVSSHQFFYSKVVYSTYNEPFGMFHSEEAGGRFHASWAYTRQLFKDIGGYTDDERLIFDQDLRHRMLALPTCFPTKYGVSPTYVYRWGNGLYHGSQAGDDGYAEFYKSLEDRPAEFIGHVVPKLDKETLSIFEKCAI